VRILCAWCANTIKVLCHCGAPLMPTDYIGSTFERNSMVCVNGQTAITYSIRTIEAMPQAFVICDECQKLTQAERDRLVSAHRQFNKRVPTPAELETILAERQAADAHESETRAKDRATIHSTAHRFNSGFPVPALLQILEQTKKRGPTGGTRSATKHAPGKPKKDGDTP
jgi:hypothetical protein